MAACRSWNGTADPRPHPIRDEGTPFLVDQGDADNFLDEQLKTHLLEEACTAAGQQATIRMQAGYDHSYYFISTFMADHIAWHAERLKA